MLLYVLGRLRLCDDDVGLCFDMNIIVITLGKLLMISGDSMLVHVSC